MISKIAALLCVGAVHGADVAVKFELRNWVVDYQRPTNAPRLAPFDVKWADKLDAYLANNSYPGPSVEANVGDTVEVSVVNELMEAQVKLLFDGVEMQASPADALRPQGGEGKYKFVVGKAGTFWWQASIPSQAQKGLMGTIVVRDPKDPDSKSYSEERVVVLSNAQARPDTCPDSSVAGCPAGKVAVNGQWGDGSKGWPTPVMEVTKGSCYRLRFLGMPSASGSYYSIAVQDHSVKILGRTGTPEKMFQLQASENIDVVLCADQNPAIFKDYKMDVNYLDKFGKPVATISSIVRYVTKEDESEKEVRALKNDRVGQEVAFDFSQCDVQYTFELKDQIVDYLRPTKNARNVIPAENRKAALLVNGQYPGPTLEAKEDDFICVTVKNNMEEEPAAIHWHGQHMRGFPAFDGVYGVHQGGIPVGSSMVYRWKANAGTSFYHGHMQALQADKGLKGAIRVLPKNDPHKHMYDEDQIVAISDEWVNPGACLKSEGAQPGNPVCAEIEKATYNGAWGDGSDEYPWPLIEVEQGKCYRLRFIGMMGQAQNFQMSLAGHNMTLIAVDGADVEPIMLSTFNLHAGERADVVVCANQEPGSYLLSGVYDLATFLETAPAPSLPKVDSSKYWAYLHYKGQPVPKSKAAKKLLGGYSDPAGVGGGASPKAVAGPVWDTNLAGAWSMVKNLVPEPQPEKADVTYTLDVGVKHPPFEAGVTPYAMSGQLYLYENMTSWKKPLTPLLHTKGECGAEGVPFINVPEGAKTVEVIINNLSPTAHVLHMHGNRFTVTNYAPYSEQWCAPARFDCFFVPISVAKLVDCGKARLGDPDKSGPGSAYWGCPYTEDERKTQMLDNPLQKDMISVFRRSWAVIRFKADSPGVWLFHCHMEQHIPTGQMMAFNVLPSKQPPIPKDIPTEGPCQVWSHASAAVRPVKDGGFWV